MRQVIKGKTYDTTTAQVVGFYKGSSTLYRRVKAKDYFMGFDISSYLVPISEFEAEKIMYRSGEFVWNE